MRAYANTASELDQWYTFHGFCEEHKNFSPTQIEWMYRNRMRNGMEEVFRKIGKRKYLHAGRFASALLEGRG